MSDQPGRVQTRRPYVEVATLVNAYTVVCGPCRWTWKHTTTDRATAENMADFHSEEAHPTAPARTPSPEPTSDTEETR